MRELPGTEDLFYWSEMIDSHLINYSHLQPWADGIIAQEKIAPAWVCDLSIKSYQPDVLAAIRLAIHENNDIPTPPAGLDRFHLACLYLRYERREISFATLLNECGRYLDGVNGELFCEHPYAMLNEYEDADYSESFESSLLEKFLGWADLKKWTLLAKVKYEPFRKIRKRNLPS